MCSYDVDTSRSRSSPASGGVQQLQALVCAVQGSAAAAAIWSQSSGGSATHDATEV